MNEKETELLATVGELQDRQVEWTRELVAIPTVNPYSGDSSAGCESAGQDWIDERMIEAGGKTSRVDIPNTVYEMGDAIGPADRSWESRDNVVGEWAFGNGRGVCVILNCHMDTVGTDGMTIPPFDPVVRDGVMYGRGTSDSKGNLIAGLTAVSALREFGDGLHGRVVLESVVDEECSGGGAGTLACCLAGITGDIAICLDGRTGEIINGCNGIATARVTVHGRGGHCSYPGAVNAIDKAIFVKEAIDRLGADYIKAYPACPTNVGVFHSGANPAVVPGSAEIQINMNYSIDEAKASESETGRWNGLLFRRRFEKAMSDLAKDDPWFSEEPAKVEWIKDSYPFETDTSGELTQTVITAASEASGKDLPVRPMPAWFDATHLRRRLGIPALGIGSGTPGMAHSSAEHARLEDLFLGARMVALALYRLLSVA